MVRVSESILFFSPMKIVNRVERNRSSRENERKISIPLRGVIRNVPTSVNQIAIISTSSLFARLLSDIGTKEFQHRKGKATKIINSLSINSRTAIGIRILLRFKLWKSRGMYVPVDGAPGGACTSCTSGFISQTPAPLLSIAAFASLCMSAFFSLGPFPCFVRSFAERQKTSRPLGKWRTVAVQWWRTIKGYRDHRF